jgi:hypothetical protein
MYKYVNDLCRLCDACQHIRRLATQSLVKLMTTLLGEPFVKWGWILWDQLNQHEGI